VTHDIHYENYRSQRLAKGAQGPSVGAPPPPTPRRALDEKDKQLLEKEAELRRMQEMVAAMQEQVSHEPIVLKIFMPELSISISDKDAVPNKPAKSCIHQYSSPKLSHSRCQITALA